MKRIAALFILLVLLSCQKRPQPYISFYYWKTIFRLSETEKLALSENQVKKIYIRYFDINLTPERQPFPQRPVIFKQYPEKIEIVPVVYIKNEVMLAPHLDVSALAKKVLNFIGQINKMNHISCTEIQIDCDWSLASRENYMAFIEAFKKLSGKKLSATIRLHQIKYFKNTRIPNVDVGVLMFYNMGKIAADSLNSIYDRNIAKQYTNSFANYPLSLNVALPVYSWAIQIRDHKVIGLKNKWPISELKNDPNLIAVSPNCFKVKISYYKHGNFFKTGDFLKVESVKPRQLKEMADDLHKNLKIPPKEIIFYDLDDLNLKNYDKSIFKEIADRF